jgi:hypothetical protein
MAVVLPSHSPTPRNLTGTGSDTIARMPNKAAALSGGAVHLRQDQAADRRRSAANSLAWRIAFWPVVAKASSTSSVSCGVLGQLLLDDAHDLLELGHQVLLRVQADPAVST